MQDFLHSDILESLNEQGLNNAMHKCRRLNLYRGALSNGARRTNNGLGFKCQVSVCRWRGNALCTAYVRPDRDQSKPMRDTLQPIRRHATNLKA